MTTQSPARQAISYVLQRYSLVLIWALMLLFFIIALPNGLDLGLAARAVLGQQTPVIFLGLAVVILMSVGEFDLSFASIYGLAAAAVPSLVVFAEWPYWAAVLAGMGLALAIGAINAVLVVPVGVDSVVVTLGTGSAALGLAYWVSQETNVSGLDRELSQITLMPILGLPALFWYGLALVAITAYVMNATPLGRSMLFVGSNRDVARLAGISVRRIRFGAYVVGAGLCGLAGVLISTGIGGFVASSSQNQLMPVFAAVFLGTIAVVPGRFNPLGMMIAAYFLLTGVFGLQLLGLSGWVTNLFYGIALVVAVTISVLLRKRIRG
ncbi:MAG: ABC transporter permease [Microbacteriaceae bacterium]|nr:ABC transporter permease [Microbacteriaceae bacterium]